MKVSVSGVLLGPLGQALTMDHVVKNTANKACVWLSAGWMTAPSACLPVSLSEMHAQAPLFFMPPLVLTLSSALTNLLSWILSYLLFLI